MFKKLTTILAAFVMTLSASSAFATFADLELIRCVYERGTGTTEFLKDLGPVKSISASEGTFSGSLPAVNNPSNLFVVYFSIDRITGEMWVSGSTDTINAPVAVGSKGFTSTKSGLTNLYSYYNNPVYGLTADANDVYTGLQSHSNSYKSKLSASQGSLANAINTATRVNTEARLASLVNGSATSIKQNLYYFTNANTANSVGVTVATITTNFDGSTTITPQTSKTPQTITFGGLAAKTHGDADFAPGATTSSGLTITYTSSNPAVVTIVNGSIHIVGAGTTNITASQSGNDTYDPAASIVQPLTVNKATPTFTWSDPAAITYGTALSATQLNATTPSVPGSFIYTPDIGTTLNAGSQILSVTFTPTDSTNYSVVTSTVNLTVNPKPLTITSDSASRIYGAANPVITGFTAVGLVAPDAVSSVITSIAASATYSATAGTTHTITPGSAVFGTGSAANYDITYAPGTLTINKAVLTVTADSLTRTVTTANPPLTYFVTGFANNENSSVLTGSPALNTTALIDSPVGTYPITATVGTLTAANYSFTFNNGTLTISSKLVPVITWTNPGAITYGTPLSATQLNATANVPGTFAYSPVLNSALNAGTHTLSTTFTPTDISTYAVASATVNLTVNKATPAITWSNPGAITYGTPLSATQLNASTAGIAGTFAYTPSAGSVMSTGIRTLSVTFTPSDSSNYIVQTATAEITVTKAVLIVTADNIDKTVNTLNPALTYTVTGFVNGESAAVLSGSPALDTTAVTGSPTGSYPITAAAGTLAAANYTFSFVNGALTVKPRAIPAITWGTPTAITFGTPLSVTQLNATSSVPGAFTYFPASGTVLNAGAHIITVTFTPTDSANYETAHATVSLTIEKATPAITWATPAAINTITPLSAVQLNATASVPGSFLYSPAVDALLPAGAQTLSVTFTPADTANYTSRSSNVVIQVNYPTGSLDGISTPALTDAMKVLKSTVNLATLTAVERRNVDVAPLVNGKPAPDGRVDPADALIIMKRVVGNLAAW